MGARPAPADSSPSASDRKPQHSSQLPLISRTIVGAGGIVGCGIAIHHCLIIAIAHARGRT
eukprot:1463617-Alexandrium_andersonii.AAC.1